MKYLALLLLIMAVSLNAQGPAGASKKGKPQAALSPLTVIPLDDASKVKILLLSRDQDAALKKRARDQIEIDALDKQIQGLQDEINQTAQQFAARDKIDVNELVLDLDKLAWVSKGAPK